MVEEIPEVSLGVMRSVQRLLRNKRNSPDLSTDTSSVTDLELCNFRSDSSDFACEVFVKVESDRQKHQGSTANHVPARAEE